MTRQIGWNTKEILLYQISKQIEYLTGVWANRVTTSSTTTLEPPYISPFKLSFAHNRGDGILYLSEIIFQSNEFDDMTSFMGGYTWNSDTLLQFNDDVIIPLTEKYELGFNNGVNNLLIQAVEGKRYTFDAQGLLGVVMDINTNNITFVRMSLINADPTDVNGYILKHDGRDGLIFNDVIFDGGNAALRTSNGISNITYDGIIIRNVTHGSFRLGDGDVIPEYDVVNIIIRNVTLEGNSGNVPGSSEPYDPLMLLKKINGLVIENLICTNGDYDLGDTELSNNVYINGMRGLVFLCKTTSNINMNNVFLSQAAQSLSMQDCDGIDITYCNVNSLAFNNCTQLGLKGNILRDGVTGTLPTRADFVYEHDDLFGPNASIRYINFLFTAEGFTSLDVHEFNYLSYRVGPWGLNTLFQAGDPGNILIDAEGYLENTSMGRNQILASLSGGVEIDITGRQRLYPGDVGPYDNNVII